MAQRDRRWLLGFAFTAALFLLVVLLTEGWGLSPLAAALVVSVMPVAAVAASRIPIGDLGLGSPAVAGAIAIAGGLAALGLIPGASADLTIAPQLLIGAGLALAIPALTVAALGARDPEGLRAAETLAARHGGIVVGILLLTPLLSVQISSQHDAGRDASSALLLDAPLSVQTKIETAARVAGAIDDADGTLPDLRPAFAEVGASEDEQGALAALEAGIDDQLERAATHAFSWPFLGAALLAALALIPIRLLREGER